jgi:hypothetical protein
MLHRYYLCDCGFHIYFRGAFAYFSTSTFGVMLGMATYLGGIRGVNVITYTNEILGNKMTQDFFTKVHLLFSKLLLIVAMHLLDGSQANQLSRVKSSAGAAHPLTR